MRLKPSKHKIFICICSVLSLAIIIQTISFVVVANQTQKNGTDGFIKWVDFNIPASAMEKALKYDIDTKNEQHHINWIELLSITGATYWGEWKKYKPADLDKIAKRLKSGEPKESIASKYDKFPYFDEAYKAVLGGLVGEYKLGKNVDASGNHIMEEKYGLKAYSPIAYGFPFSHYDDFGNGRSFGYARKHLGNDLMASVGTPIVAVESGTVTKCGWNEYGGWRLGIKSFDGLRYYYYAHCRKDQPFAENLKEGDVVSAGQHIGYVGMTGYSTNENVNGMKKPHLHFGLQLIFDPSQEEGNGEIWVDVYQIVNFLEHHKSVLSKNKENGQYTQKYKFVDPLLPNNS